MPELLPAAQWMPYLRHNRLRILMYHSISDDPSDPISVTPQMFADQMALLAERSFQGITMSEGLALIDAGRPANRKVVITFDDGFRDFVTTALPVLRRHGFRATQFVVTQAIGRASFWSRYRSDRPVMTEAEIREARSAGTEIGSHTVSHPDLRTLSDTELAEELCASRGQLEELLGEPVVHLAYPGGAFAAREMSAAKTAGYRSAVIVGGAWANGPETDRLRLKREKMGRADTLEWFWRKTGGYYEPYEVMRRLRARIGGAAA